MIALILESAARTFVLAAAASAALRLLRVTNVVAQKIAWSIVLAAAVAMPSVVRQHWVRLPAIAIPASAIPASWTTHAYVSEPVLHVIAPPPEQQATAPVIIDASAAAPSPAPAASAAQSAPRQWTLAQLRTLVVPAYLAVSGFLLLRLLLGLALAFRVWYRAEPASVLVDPRADVRFSDDIRTPVTIGLGIVLPRSFENWNRRRLHIVLAHERAHVRQADFYLQLLARLHTAVFWFSPAAWWIQKHLSDLGEAISDYAAMTEASDAPSYAELLLEVSAIPRQPLFAVPMARSTRMERRLDRILTDVLFRRSFIEHKRRALAVAAILPVILAASSSLLVVRAAEVPPFAVPSMHVIAQDDPPLTATKPTPEPAGLPAVPVAKPAPLVAASAVAVQATPAPAPPTPPSHPEIDQDADTYFSDSGQDSFMVVDGGQSHMFNVHGGYSEMESLSKKVHGNYILAERGAKYYVIDDPTIIEQTRKLFAPMEELGRQQEALGAQQAKLGEQQEKLGKLQEQAHIETPDMSKEIAELQQAIKQLQDLQKSKTVTQSELADIQGRIGSIEGRFGAMQGQIGAQEGELGRQQGELGRQQGELGRQQGGLGREQGRLAREASRQMRTMIDQAFKDGKAKPVQ
jgi:beta-lactamase regulating signal transducer with metallopeptidase domain